MFFSFPEEIISKHKWIYISLFLSFDFFLSLINLLNSILPENATTMEKFQKIIFYESEFEVQMGHLQLFFKYKKKTRI
jgi:hypothetical protein